MCCVRDRGSMLSVYGEGRQEKEVGNLSWLGIVSRLASH